MDIFDFIFLLIQVVIIVDWWRFLVRTLKEARAESAIVPSSVRLACVLVGIASVSWAVCSLVLSLRALDTEGIVQAVMNATFCFSFLALLALSLSRGGKASYWVLLVFAIPLFLLISGAVMVFQGSLLFDGSWLGVLGWLGWLFCAAAIVLLLLPQSFRFFRAAYLAAMESKNPRGSRVG